ncbi:hypothetical protein Bca4012_062892 [Brassica carinata]
MWTTHVYRWAGGLLWLGHGSGKSPWDCFGHVQEWFGRPKTSGNFHRRMGVIWTIDEI